MCRSETRVRVRLTCVVGCALFAHLLSAQTPTDSSLIWRKIGGTTTAENLAAPSTGGVREVWYGEGGRLFARTDSRRIFETLDFEHWRLNSTAISPGAVTRAGDTRRYLATSDNIYASDDAGKTWINLTGFNNRSILGGGFSSLAISPADSRQITAANRHGIWRSLDGGLSWHGLNNDLPNLQARKLAGRRAVVLVQGAVAELEAGVWAIREGAADSEVELNADATRRSRLHVTASARVGSFIYGALQDGRVAASRDGGNTWSVAGTISGVAGDRVWVAATRPESALVAQGSRLLRTVNGGLFWDDVTAGSPASAIHGIAADVTASVIYLATDRGVYSGNISLNDAGPVTPGWKLLSRDLPAAPAWDVRLNTDNTLTVALDGYGVFETAAPHKMRGVRLVNGADMSDRAAAPGSLISVMGANVRQGRVGNVSYPVIAASEDNSQLQVPFEVASGVYQMALEGAADRWAVPLTVKDASPAIFVDPDGSPVLLDAESGLNLDSKIAVQAGATVQMLATGLGRVTPDWPSGVAAPFDAPPSVRGTVTAFLDGTPVEVTRATLAPGYIGYYMVELRIPRIVNRGVAELRLVMNGEESNRVRLYLDNDSADLSRPGR